MRWFLRLFRNVRFALGLALICLGLFIQAVFAQDERVFYAPQRGTPAGIPNFVQPESGCDWAGIGGQVFDRSGEPLTGLVVKLGGILEGQNILIYAVTGGALQFGPGGYLIEIADHPAATSGSLSLQILDITGAEISAPIRLNTYGDCSKNLLLVNVKEMLLQNPLYLPLIHR